MDLPIPFDANGLGTVSMALQNRMMTLVAFLQAQNCSNLPGSWRHPATMLDFLRLRQAEMLDPIGVVVNHTGRHAIARLHCAASLWLATAGCR